MQLIRVYGRVIWIRLFCLFICAFQGFAYCVGASSQFENLYDSEICLLTGCVFDCTSFPRKLRRCMFLFQRCASSFQRFWYITCFSPVFLFSPESGPTFGMSFGFKKLGARHFFFCLFVLCLGQTILPLPQNQWFTVSFD